MRRQKVWVRMGMWAALPALVLLLSSAIPTQMAADSRPVSPWRETASAAPNAGWHEVGAHSATGSGISNNQGGSYPAIAIAPDGTAYVAWQSWDGSDNEIYIRRWNSTAWVWAEVGAGSATGGGVSNNDLDSTDPSLTIAPDGTPYLAWADYDDSDYSQDVYVWRWNGAAWVQVGAGPVSGDLSSDFMAGSLHPALSIAPDGTPYLAWFHWDDNGGSNYVRRWNGSAWVDVGAGPIVEGSLFESGPNEPSIATAPDGKLYVTWNQHGSEESWRGEIYILSWDGSTWNEVGAGSASGGGISNSGGTAEATWIAVAPDGTPYVAWTDSSGPDTEIYVRHWDGSAWNEVGTGSATGGGISDDDAGSCCQSLAIAPDGTPYVAWKAAEPPVGEIYVRRWYNGAWRQAGTGSASGGGISDNPSNSEPGVIAVDPRGRVWAAWPDDGDGDYEIYVRRWNPDPMLWLPIVFKES